MDSKRDDLDRLIENSFIEIKIEGSLNEEYNNKLLLRLHREKSAGPRIRTAAVSLIAAGFLMAVIYTSGVQYSLTYFQCKIKTDFVIMKNNINIEKYILGE